MFLWIFLGTLVVTIVDVNDVPPTFAAPWTLDNPNILFEIPEGQPIGSIAYTFKAEDEDSNIAGFILGNETDYFTLNNATGEAFSWYYHIGDGNRTSIF